MSNISKVKYDEALSKLEAIMSVLGAGPYSEEDAELWELADYYRSIIEEYRSSNKPPCGACEHNLKCP